METAPDIHSWQTFEVIRAMNPLVTDPDELDLRGIRCPINWARAKVRLESLHRGDRLAVWIDDERSLRDLPRAAEAEGYAVLAVHQTNEDWRILIEV